MKDKKIKATDIMLVQMFEPDERFIEYLKKNDQDFIQKYDVYDLFGMIDGEFIVYFKDSKEFVGLHEVIACANTVYANIAIDNIIIFEYEANYFIMEEISNVGLDEFIGDIILEWEEHLNKRLHNNISLFQVHKTGRKQLEGIAFHTAWNAWSCYDSYNGEYDGGVDCVGIIDMCNLNIIEK